MSVGDVYSGLRKGACFSYIMQCWKWLAPWSISFSSLHNLRLAPLTTGIMAKSGGKVDKVDVLATFHQK